MSNHHDPAHHAEHLDTVDAAVPHISLVLPIVGGIVIFLLAFIAVNMA